MRGAKNSRPGDDDDQFCGVAFESGFLATIKQRASWPYVTFSQNRAGNFKAKKQQCLLASISGAVQMHEISVSEADFFLRRFFFIPTQTVPRYGQWFLNAVG